MKYQWRASNIHIIVSFDLNIFLQVAFSLSDRKLSILTISSSETTLGATALPGGKVLSLNRCF
ncbi:hypothetical protein LI291_02335 [Intestinibacillus massiliensis]|nr:hypothetical protein [Intestinibacillus massiliensis]